MQIESVARALPAPGVIQGRNRIERFFQRAPKTRRTFLKSLGGFMALKALPSMALPLSRLLQSSPRLLWHTQLGTQDQFLAAEPYFVGNAQVLVALGDYVGKNYDFGGKYSYSVKLLGLNDGQCQMLGNYSSSLTFSKQRSGIRGLGMWLPGILGQSTTRRYFVFRTYEFSKNWYDGFSLDLVRLQKISPVEALALQTPAMDQAFLNYQRDCTSWLAGTSIKEVTTASGAVTHYESGRVSLRQNGLEIWGQPCEFETLTRLLGPSPSGIPIYGPSPNFVMTPTGRIMAYSAQGIFALIDPGQNVESTKPIATPTDSQ